MNNIQEKIAKRAFELFQARGGQHGYHIADWLQAEKEMTPSKSKTPVAPVAPAKSASVESVAEKTKSSPVARKKTVAKK